MQPNLPSALNRNRKFHEEQVTLSVSAGLFVARLCVSLHIWFILSLSFSAEVFFSLLVHTQASSVATLVLAIHHFSDDVSNADEQQL